MAKRSSLWSHLDISEGDVLAGKYRIDSVLGSGGMGTVLRATHLALKDRVALKVLQKGASGEAAERFFREAQAAARIKSPHVARVLDVGKLDSGAPYIVMEYLAGRDLGRVLRDAGPLPVGDAVDYVLQTCEALAAAHALGVIHRDIKPSNLFLGRDADGGPLVKVVDFGVSKQTRASEYSSLTGVQSAIGTPSYMSPEQLKSSKSVDARADLWSLGVVLYELLTGRLPFDADSLAGLVAMLVDPNAVAPPLREQRADIPAELEAIVLCCLEKDPAQRYADVSELASALAPHGGDAAVASAARTARILTAAKPESARDGEMTLPGLGEPRDTGTAFSSTRWPWVWARSAPDAHKFAVVAVILAFIGGWAILPRVLSRPRVSASALPAAASATIAGSNDGPGTAPTISVSPSDAVQIEDLPVQKNKGGWLRGAPGKAPLPSVAKSAAPLAPSAQPGPSAAPKPPSAPPSDDMSNPYELEINPYK